MLDDLNLRVGSIAFPTRRGYSNPTDLQPRIEATRAAMQLASKLGARVLIGNLGEVPSEDDPSKLASLIDAVQTLSTLGDRLGVRLAMQSPSTGQELLAFIQTLPEGCMSLDLHPSKLISRSESPADFVADTGRHIAHVHATDGVYDLSTRSAVEVELGRGTADFPELLGLLEEHGYRDWLTVERSNSRQPIEEMGNAVAYLRSL